MFDIISSLHCVADKRFEKSQFYYITLYIKKQEEKAKKRSLTVKLSS